MVPRRRKNCCFGLLVIGLAVISCAPEAAACSWVDRPFSEWYADADEIVVARIEATRMDDGGDWGRQHVTYRVVEEFKGNESVTGEALATIFFMCGGGGYFPGRTYLLFIGGSDRMISDINSKILSEDPVVREQQLQPLRDFESGNGEGFGSPNDLVAGAPDSGTGNRCDGVGIRGLSNFPYYPTLRNAFVNSDILVRAQIVGQSIGVSGDVVIDTRVVETYKGEPNDNRSFIAPVIATPEWMTSCLLLLNGWEYLIYANGAEGRIDGRHSTSLMPSLAPSELEALSNGDNPWLDQADLQGLEMLRILGSK